MAENKEKKKDMKNTGEVKKPVRRKKRKKFVTRNVRPTHPVRTYQDKIENKQRLEENKINRGLRRFNMVITQDEIDEWLVNHEINDEVKHVARTLGYQFLETKNLKYLRDDQFAKIMIIFDKSGIYHL